MINGAVDSLLQCASTLVVVSTVPTCRLTGEFTPKTSAASSLHDDRVPGIESGSVSMAVATSEELLALVQVPLIHILTIVLQHCFQVLSQPVMNCFCRK
jgi:hypothetical protein